MHPLSRASQAGRSLRHLSPKAQGIAGLAVAADHTLWNSSWPWAQGIAGALHSGPPSGGIDARCPRQTLYFLASAKASQARGHCGPHQRWNYRNLGCKAAKTFGKKYMRDASSYNVTQGVTRRLVFVWRNHSHRGPPMDSFAGAICSKWMVDPLVIFQERRCQPSLNT